MDLKLALQLRSRKYAAPRESIATQECKYYDSWLMISLTHVSALLRCFSKSPLRNT